MTIPVALEDGRRLGLFRGITYVICMMLAGAIVWASLAPIREVAMAAGQILPRQSIQPVHHFEGGIVAEVLVREGQTVAAGDPLIRLEPTAAGADLGQIVSRGANLRLQIQRVEGLLADQVPDFGPMGGDADGLAATQLAVYHAQHAAHQRERATLRHRIAQRRSEIDKLSAEIEGLEVQTGIKQEQLKIQDELVKQGYTSRRAFLDAQSAYEATRAQLAQSRGNLVAAKSALEEAQSMLNEYEATLTRTLVEEKSKVRAELSEIEQALVKHKDRVDRLYVRAPVGGDVHDLKPKGRGDVISPGDKVASIVPPSRDTVIAEVQLQPRDAGHVNIGDKAEIKVTAFDPAMFGAISGEVYSISPATFMTERGEAYYKVELLIDDDVRHFHGREIHMLTGMEVQAEIITGSKSLMRYLLKPIFRAVDTAFVER